MLRAPQSKLFLPTTLDQALDFLDEDPEGTVVMAGGTDLLPNLKRRTESATRWVSLRRVGELGGVRLLDNGDLLIGAIESLASIASDEIVCARYPALAQAAGSAASPALRNTGTIGGNICLDTRCTYYNQSEEWRRAISFCMKERGSVCWTAPGSDRCWAVNSSDTAPVLCALGAAFEVVSKTGSRRIAAGDFFRDDGIRFHVLEQAEILAAIRLPPPKGERTAFAKLSRRASIDFPVLNAAASIRWNEETEDKIVVEAEVFLGAVASAPMRADACCETLIGSPLDDETIARAAALARRAAKPLPNTDFTPQWRGRMIETFVARVLHAARNQAPSATTDP